MPDTYESLENERQELVAKYWNKELKCWNVPTPEETAELQRRYRQLSHGIRFLTEEYQVTDVKTDKELREKLYPLVMRRKAGRLYGDNTITPTGRRMAELRIGTEFYTPEGLRTLQGDGDQFCFEAPEIIENKIALCGCGTIEDGWHPKTAEDIAFAEKHMSQCPDPIVQSIETTERQRIKHSRGDWNCRGCFNIGVEAGSTETKKWVDWCPNFIAEARTATLLNAVVMHKELKCYGGLMHSQLVTGERETVQTETGTKTRQHNKIVHMCDTCGHREEEDKISEWTETDDKVVTLE